MNSIKCTKTIRVARYSLLGRLECVQMDLGILECEPSITPIRMYLLTGTAITFPSVNKRKEGLTHKESQLSSY